MFVNILNAIEELIRSDCQVTFYLDEKGEEFIAGIPIKITPDQSKVKIERIEREHRDDPYLFLPIKDIFWIVKHDPTSFQFVEVVWKRPSMD